MMNLFQLFFKGQEPGKVRAGAFVILGFVFLSALTVACRSGDSNGEDGERGGSLPDGYTVTGQIKSTIIDTLSGAQVVLKQDGQTVESTTTGLDGLYAFEGLEAGTYLVEASAARHTTKATAAFDLSEDKANVDITLTRELTAPLEGELVASLHSPWGLAFGPDGDLYMSGASIEYQNNKIQKITPGSPTITDVAGTGVRGSADGPVDSAQFDHPNGLCFAPNGSLYVADSTNNRIREIAIADGEVRTAAGTGNYGYCVEGGSPLSTILPRPNGVAFINGELYFTELGYYIWKISQYGKIARVAGNGYRGPNGDGGPARDAQIQPVYCLAAGPDGSLYFAEGDRVRKIDSAGIITTVEGSITAGNWSSSFGIAVDAAGTVYVAYSHDTNPRVVMLRDGVSTVLVSGLGSGNGQLRYPEGIAIGPDGYLYVADTGNNRIMRY
jgi:sugar lactone lactonase YvrE